MSYILEALKKSEQERQIGQVPDFTQMQELPQPAPSRWPRWLLLALLVNAVILLVLAWRTWEARTQEAAVPAVPTTEMARAPVAVVPAPVAAASAPVVQNAPAPLPAPVAEPQQPPAAVTQDYAPVTMLEAPLSEAAEEPLISAPPRWDDLPLAERAELPAPSIDVHVFAQEPERRFVLINLRKYRVGDQLDTGPTLVAILNDGIVLSYAGREYRVNRP